MHIRHCAQVWAGRLKPTADGIGEGFEMSVTSEHRSVAAPALSSRVLFFLIAETAPGPRWSAAAHYPPPQIPA